MLAEPSTVQNSDTPPLKKLVLMHVVMARRLRLYFQTHPIIVLTNQPLMVVLQKPEVSSRLVKWAIELGEHDVSYRLKIAIKGQILAYFLA